MTSAHLSIIPEFQEKIGLLEADGSFLINKAEIINIESASQIIFRGLKTSSGDQTANLKSLQGVTTWIVDEAEELQDEKTFDKINLSVRQKDAQNRIILILNPATKEHWIYKRFFESAGVQPGFNGISGNVTYIHTSYLDNIANLDQSFIEEVELMRERNPKKYEHQINGAWLDKAEGVIYNNWKFGEFKEIGVPVFGQDFGFSIDPTTLIEVCIDRSNMTIYVREHLYKPKLSTSEIRDYNRLYAGKHLIYADGAEPRLISELAAQGLNIKAAPTKDIEAGILILQDWHIVVSHESLNIVRELNNYIWNDKKSGTPIDDYNHALDPLRYIALALLGTDRSVKRPRTSF